MRCKIFNRIQKVLVDDTLNSENIPTVEGFGEPAGSTAQV